MRIPIKYYKTILAFFLSIIFGLFSFASIDVKELRCEYLVNPIGFDVEKPRLSWKIISENDRVDIAFKLLMRKEFSSWLYPVTIVLPLQMPGLVKMNRKKVEMDSGYRLEIGSGNYQIEFGY